MKTIIPILVATLFMGITSSSLAHEPDQLASAKNKLHIEQLINTPLNNEFKISVLQVELAAGFREPTHTHPGEEVLYILDGQGKLWRDGQPLTISAGDTILVPEGTHKALDNSSGQGPLKVLVYLAIKNDQPPLAITEHDAPENTQPSEP